MSDYTPSVEFSGKPEDLFADGAMLANMGRKGIAEITAHRGSALQLTGALMGNTGKLVGDPDHQQTFGGEAALPPECDRLEACCDKFLEVKAEQDASEGHSMNPLLMLLLKQMLRLALDQLL